MSRRRRRRDEGDGGGTRRGIALVAVVGIMSLVALVSVSLLSAAVRLRQGAAGAVGDATLDARLHAVIETTIADWPVDLPELAIGASRTIMPAATDTVRVTRLSSALHLLNASVSGASGARRRATMTLRTPRLDAADLSAFVSYTSVVLGDSVTVEQGSDSLSCPASAPAAVLVPPGADITGPPPGPARRVSDRAGWASTHLTLAGTSIARLAAAADNVIPAGGTLTLNGASPGVVRAVGDLTVNGAGGVVLIVDGRLRLGDARVSGVVVAAGGVETVADGAEITGLLIAGRRADGQGSAPSRLMHRATLRFSTCIAQEVVTKAVRPWPIRGRPWAELH